MSASGRRAAAISSRGDEVLVRALSSSGGVTINAASTRGFVTYVGRLIVR